MKKTFKIAILIDQLFPGGVQKIALKEAIHFKKLGHKVSFFVLMKRGFEYHYQDLIKKLDIKFLSDHYPKFLRKAWRIPGFRFLTTLLFINPFLAPKLFKPREFEVILSHGTTTTFTARRIFQKKKIPYFAFVYDPMIYIIKKAYGDSFLKYFFWFLIPFIKRWEKKLLKDSLTVFTQSSVHQESLKEIYGIKAHLLTLGIDYYNLNPYKRGDKILALSTWNKNKKPSFLLDILTRIPQANLILAGSWPQKNELREFKKEIKKRGLKKRVTLVTDFLESHKSFLFAQARLYVHPILEAFGLGALEAAAAGLPIIIPQKSGVTRYFQNNVHGFFPPEGDIEKFVEKIKFLLENKNEAINMGFRAQEQIKKKYTWSFHVKEILKYLEKKFKKDKKILVLELGHVAKTGLAGGDRLLEAMCSYLPSSLKLQVIVSSLGVGHWQKVNYSQVDYFSLPSNKFENKSDPVSVFLSYLIRIYQSLKYAQRKADKVDIIYSSTNLFPDVWPAFLLKKKFPHLKWFARIHHLIPPPSQREGRLIVNIVSYFLQRINNNLMKRKADIIGVLNNPLKKELIKKSFSPKKLKVIGGGVDLEKIKNYPLLSNSPSFDGIYLGRLHITKGIEDAVEIWQKVITQLPLVTLAFIGPGPEEIKDFLAKKIKNLNLEKNIKILGFLPERELFSVLKKSKVFLFTDHEAGFGLAIAEAMACGLPVVGYDLPIFGDVYKKGFLTVPFQNKEIFAQKIITLLTQKVLRKKIALEAKQEAIRHCWSKTAAQFVKIVSSL
jgi:glycosyltransferase involved in cell wall biosynthesis